MKHKARQVALSPAMTVEEFDNGYWYATEIRSFATTLGISGVSGLRKDELEDLIRGFLRTGKLDPVPARSTPVSGTRDSDHGITRRRRVVNYTNDRATKDFLEQERARLSPGQRQKSGARYRLNRWREEQVLAGEPITYGDLAKKYVELSDVEGAFPQARSGRYVNFLSDFLRCEQNMSMEDAISAWHEVKVLDCPKTYASWKKLSIARGNAEGKEHLGGGC